MDRKTLNAYLRLMRPPNLPTAAADILAGASICGVFQQPDARLIGSLLFLVLASVCLYAGGVVLNDVFDARIDAVERPERPIPSGVVPLSNAMFFGSVLLVLGVALAGLARIESAYVAVLLAAAILFYNGYAKRYDGIGPLAMGLCRGLNLLLGMSLVTISGEARYLWIPVLYIFAVTTVSRGEVHAGNKKQLIFAALMYGITFLGVGILTGMESPHKGLLGLSWMLLGLLAVVVYLPLSEAYRVNDPGNIRKAVKAGVLGIIFLDAAWAAAYGGYVPALATMALLPLSKYLAGRFAVT